MGNHKNKLSISKIPTMPPAKNNTNLISKQEELFFIAK